MQKFIGFAAAVALVLGAAGTAGAAPLNWEGTSRTILADLADIQFFGGGVATVNNSAGVVPAHLQTLRLKASRGNISGITTVPITDPDTIGNGIAAIIVDATLGTGTLAPISGGAASTTVLAQNQMAVRGVAKICLLSTSCTSFLELFLTEQLTVNGVATQTIGVGIGGLLTVGQGAIRISLEGAPWTIKTASVTDQVTTTSLNTTFITLTAKGFAHDPGSGTTNTAQPSGVVQLVTPAQVTTNLVFGTAQKLGVLLVLTVHFIPEPGLLLLLGSGVAGLVLIGRRKIRK